MRVTKEQAAKNRASLITSASRLFRERGIDGVGVADIGAEAGLTHGALYAQFSSKDELAAEALAYGMKELAARVRSRTPEQPQLSDYLNQYLTKKHRDAIATGCPIAASGSEVARQDKAVSRSFADGFQEMADALQPTLGPNAASARERALAIAAAEIGAIIVARGIAKSDPRLSEDVINATRNVLEQLGGTNSARRSRSSSATSRKASS